MAGGARFEAGGADVEFLGRVSDEELVDLYRGASVFLDPSLYEGFGYGVLEAMACGAPVVASDRTSMPEVVGEAGLLCDPESPAELAAAVRRVLDEPPLAAELRERGRLRAAAFSWGETAAASARPSTGREEPARLPDIGRRPEEPTVSARPPAEAEARAPAQP